jgi:hypothetical protein
MVLFEVCAHPLASHARCRSAILLLDALVQSLSLTCIDASDQQASIFPAGQIASLPISEPSATTPACACESWHFSHPQPTGAQAWALSNRSVLDIRKDETRKMVWSTLQTLAAHTNREIEFGRGFFPLFTTEPFNVSCSPLSHS